jgi:hypothetical protein
VSVDEVFELRNSRHRHTATKSNSPRPFGVEREETEQTIRDEANGFGYTNASCRTMAGIGDA